jgi:hypothetical protein
MCPTTTELAAQVTYTDAPLLGADLSQFIALETKGATAVSTYVPAGAKGLVSGGPEVVVQYLVQTAEEELGQYLLGELLQKLCQKGGVNSYFPNTCAGSLSLIFQSSATINSDLEQLRLAVRSDVESLPSCLIFQRSGTQSLSGYLLKAFADQVMRDTKHDYKGLLHGLAINPVALKECNGYPTTQNAGCHIYLAIVAIDAALIVKDQVTIPSGYTGLLSGTDAKAIDGAAKDVAGAFLADLSIAECSTPATPIPSDLCSGAAASLSAWWLDKLGRMWLDPPITLPGGASVKNLSAQLADFLRAADSALAVDQQVKSLVALTSGGGSAAAPGHTQTTAEKALAQSTQAQVQALETGLVGSVGQLVSNGLTAFAVLSVPTTNAANIAAKNATQIQQQQILQLVHAATDAFAVYKDYQQGDYAQGVSAALTFTKVVCSSGAGVGAKTDSPCGFLLSNNTLTTSADVIGVVAQLAAAQNATDVKNIAESNGGGVNAWSLKNKETMVWLGSFVGAQAGGERLSAAGYTHTHADYGLFAPLGLGYSWPNVLAHRPMNVYLSVVDLGSLVSSSGVSSSSGQVKGGANSGWSQLLAPGIYTSWRAIGPLYVGLGYVFRTPSLRTVTTTSGATTAADSNRVELFLGVDVTLFGIHP